ncbi:MAG: hypothetical protein HOD28_01635 [Candidatus Marinimicrobia bacterium]|jgi:hypothetical protein|nr:hypothetical protein [Candidatus Neomarinimicrobiota bacterium]
MPYTLEELKKNEFWLKLHEQDRVDYQKKLEQAETFGDISEIVDDEGNVIQVNKTTPMRNSVNTFLAFEDPDTGLNYERPDQYVSVNKKSYMYHGGEIRDKVLDREIKELI